VALAVGRPTGLDETVVERQVVPDRVAPSRAPGPEVRVIVQYVLVDVGQHELALGRSEYGHGDESDVAVLRLGLVGRLQSGARAPAAGMEERDRKPRLVDGRGRGRIYRAHGAPSAGQPQPFGLQRVIVQMQSVPVEVGLRRRVGGGDAGLRALLQLIVGGGDHGGPAAHDGGTVANEHNNSAAHALSAAVHVDLYTRAIIIGVRLRRAAAAHSPPPAGRAAVQQQIHKHRTGRRRAYVRKYIQIFVLFSFCRSRMCVCVCDVRFLCFDFCAPFRHQSVTVSLRPHRRVSCARFILSA